LSVSAIDLVCSKVGSKLPIGIKISYLDRKVTQYVIQNNGDKAVKKFYIDHTADTKNDGYVIETKDNCVKSVIGFSRYLISLKPQEKLEFNVKESATYTTETTNINALETFVTKQVPDLLKDKVKGVNSELIDTLKKIVGKKDLISAIEKMSSQNFTEKENLKWAELYFETKLISESIKDKLSKHLKSVKELAEITSQTNEANDAVTRNHKNQERIRENIKSLEKMPGSDLMKRYLNDMDKEEDELKRLKDILDKLNKEKNDSTKKKSENSLQLSLECDAILATLR